MSDSNKRPDPTPEKILESIREIMSSDSGRPKANPVQQTAEERQDTTASDVLELTQELPPDEMRPSEGRTLVNPVGTASDGILSVNPMPSGLPAEFDSLSNLVAGLAGGGDTKESDAFREAVRDHIDPLVREWMDANLPDIVSTIVVREVRDLLQIARDQEMRDREMNEEKGRAAEDETGTL